MVASVVDSIQQTLERLQVQTSTESSDSTGTAYTMIVQSTAASFCVRQALTEPVSQVSLYQQAGLPTPAENAHLDWFGASWWQRVVQQLIAAAAAASSSGSRAVVYLQTLPHHDSVVSDKHVHVVNLADNPWGWDDKKDNNEKEAKGDAIGLNSLTDILDAVQTRVASSHSVCNLVVDSLTPLWMRHGAAKVVSFIQRLQRIPQISTLLLHATDTLPAVLHSALEDEAHALLSLREGKAVWMHQGVRERDNMMRQVMKFSLQDGSIELVETSLSSSNQPMVAATPDDAPQEEEEEASTRTTANATTTTRSGRPRVQLKLEEEEQKKPPAPTSGPRIFMQDDDPEFDDYDEEDPDDDLDI